MKYFCSKCGKTTQYSFEMPSFCAFCGQAFANKSETKNIESQRNKFLNELKLKKNTNTIDLESDELYSSENNIDFKKIKPSFKVNVYQPKGQSFGSLIDNPSAPPEVNNQYTAETKTKEEILAEFQKEAGSLRSK